MRSALPLLVLLSACAGEAPTQPLGWLAGCWTDGTTTERWTAAGGGYLFGHNVVVADGEIRFFEQLRIEPSDAGPVYHAYPRGVGPVAFVAEASAERAVSFVNGSHDYPQRIAYERSGDSLTATVSLLDGTKPGTWVYRRCPD